MLTNRFITLTNGFITLLKRFVTLTNSLITLLKRFVSLALEGRGLILQAEDLVAQALELLPELLSLLISELAAGFVLFTELALFRLVTLILLRKAVLGQIGPAFVLLFPVGLPSLLVRLPAGMGRLVLGG